jgi:multidrug efflux pump subunit AcrA (membrane-fusion protein)
MGEPGQGQQSPQATGGQNQKAQFLDNAMWGRLFDAQSIEETAKAWLSLQCAQIRGAQHAVVVLGSDAGGSFSPAANWPLDSRPSAGLMQIAEVAMAERRSIARQDSAESSGSGTISQLAVPLLFNSRLHGVVALECDRANERDLALKLRQMQWGVAQLEAAILRRQPATLDRSEERLRSALDNAVACLESDGFLMASSVLVNRLATRFSAARVMLGELYGQGVRVVALSGAAQVNLKANLIQSVAAAMQESIDQHCPVMLPPADEHDTQNRRAHQELALGEGYGGLCTVPIYDQAQAIGALMLEREQPFLKEELALLEETAALCGPVLHLKRLNDRSTLAVARDNAMRWLQALIGPSHAVLKAVTALLAGVIVAMSLIHGEYRVRASAVLEGALERVVTAPYAGYVSSAAIRPGDLVELDQELATLEDKDLRLDLTRWISQKSQLERQYFEAIAQRERAGIQIFKAQIDQADAQIELLNEQLSRSQIRAPFAGVVVAGDLSRSIGEPVERGEILFKVAPLEDYRIALSIDERDIAELKVGQQGELVLTSLPDLYLPLEVEKITPVASTAEGINVFRVEARLLDNIPGLRPGMTGTGKVNVGERRLVWIWTHRMFDWLRIFSWRWLP